MRLGWMMKAMAVSCTLAGLLVVAAGESNSGWENKQKLY
jgi:hypothetical protein